MNMDRLHNEKLKRARKMHGWSQEELARQVSRLAASMDHQNVALDTTTISRWERGLNSPSPFYQQILCRLFEMNAEELGILPSGSTFQPVENASSPPNLHLSEAPLAEGTMPILQMHELDTSNATKQDGENRRSEEVETSPSSSVAPPLVRRRRLLVMLLTSVSLGGGAVLVKDLFLNGNQSHSASTRASRHWPEITPNIHKRAGSVRVIQWMLRARGAQVWVDGIFWMQTEIAVRDFQDNASLPVTGTVSGPTWERLIMPSEMVGKKIADLGSHVKALQEQLNIYGASPRLRVDGDFDQQTEEAVKHFQRTTHLATTGKADLDTWCLLVGGHLG